MMNSACKQWSAGDPVLGAYHDHEWCQINHDDQYLFEMLILEGVSVGLSWQIILHKRPAYRNAFHNFDINACAAMTDAELDALLNNPNLIRNHNKIYSVRSNAIAVQAIQKEFGSFDQYVWHFSNQQQIDGHWQTPQDVPTISTISINLSRDMKKRGIKFMGPTITYSFMQAIGMVNDHLIDCENR